VVFCPCISSLIQTSPRNFSPADAAVSAWTLKKKRGRLTGDCHDETLSLTASAQEGPRAEGHSLCGLKEGPSAWIWTLTVGHD